MLGREKEISYCSFMRISQDLARRTVEKRRLKMEEEKKKVRWWKVIINFFKSNISNGYPHPCLAIRSARLSRP